MNLNEIKYPIPLTEERMAWVTVPKDLTNEELDKIIRLFNVCN